LTLTDQFVAKAYTIWMPPPASLMAAGMMPGLYGPTGSLRSCFGTRWAALGACTGRVEVLLGIAHSSGQHRSAKHKQNIADDRPGYRRLHDIVEPRTQRSQ